MSKFLESLVRSEEKSCTGKIKFPREDSAERAARDMEKKKGNGEIFEHYKCIFCEGDVWHIGHRTNFDWIPLSHTSYTLMIIKHLCSGGGCVPDKNTFFTSTVVSNRILEQFPGFATLPGKNATCPFCRSNQTDEGRRIFFPLSEINPDSTETVEELWERHKKESLCPACQEKD